MLIIWHLVLYLSFYPFVPGICGLTNREHVDKDFGAKIVKGNQEILEVAESGRIERQAPFDGINGLSPTTVPVVPVVEQHIHHHHIDHVVSHEEEVPEIDVWDIRDSVPGTPNEDYPVLRSIPKTKFSCEGMISGYYADSETKCQVFHRCSEHEESARKRMDSFLCLNGTTFNQEILSCDWWENVRCENATKYYGLNQELNMRGEDGKYVQLSAKRAAISKMGKPLSPGIIPKNERVPLPPQFRSPLNRIQATEGPPLDEDEVEALVEEAEEEIEEIPEIEEVQFEPTTTRRPKTREEEEEDEDIAYFFTPEQIKTIRASQDFGEKLKSGGNGNKLTAPRTKPQFRKETPTERPPTPSPAPTTTTNFNFRFQNKGEQKNTENSTFPPYPYHLRANIVSTPTAPSISSVEATPPSSSSQTTPSDSSFEPTPSAYSFETASSSSSFQTTSSSSSSQTAPSTSSVQTTASTGTPDSTYRIPVYRSARMKTDTEVLFESKNKVKEEDLFENKLKEKRPVVSTYSSEDEFEDEPAPKVPKRVRRLRKSRKSKPRKEKAAVFPGGLPFPSEQQLVYPNGTKKLLKFKHLIHTDVTESFPPYYSGGRPPIGYPHTGLNPYTNPYQNPYSGLYPQNAAYSGLYPQNAAYSGLYPQNAAYSGLYPQTAAYSGLYPQNAAYSGVYPQNSAYTGLYHPYAGGAYSSGLYQVDPYNGLPLQTGNYNGLYSQLGAYSGLGANPYNLGQYAYNNANYPYQNGLGFPGVLGSSSLGGASFPFQSAHPALTYEHHHHHKEGTLHRALEPHHVFPKQVGSIPERFLPPHHVVPAYYHALPVNVAEPVKSEDAAEGMATSTAENVESEDSVGGMHLVRSHHALAAVPLSVNLGDRFAHHYHNIVPENPIAAHHYATESHLAVAAFHHLVEPHPVIPVPVPVPAYMSGLPTVYSHGAPTPPSAPAQIQSPQSRNSVEVHALKNPESPFPLTDILGMLGSS